VFDPVNAIFHLSGADGGAELVFPFGAPGDTPVRGDWNGDGVTTVGVFRDGGYQLTDTNGTGGAVQSIQLQGAILPGTGDWEGVGADLLEGVQGNLFTQCTDLACLQPARQFAFGIAGDVPLAGDWDGDGIDTVGVYRPGDGNVYLRNSNTTGFAEIQFFAGPGQPVVGDWEGNGVDTVAMFEDATATFSLLDCEGAVERTVAYGQPGDVPLGGGHWLR
jgi:hypothetical protein